MSNFRDVTDEPWYANWDNVIALGRWLVDEHGFNGPQLLAYFSKSWNWSTEWREYQETLGIVPLAEREPTFDSACG